MIRADALLRVAAARLSAAGTASPGAEARTLLAHVLDLPPVRLALVGEVPDAAEDRFRDLVERRATGAPVQHLTGRAYFRHVEVAVGPGVFVPRPETEVMTGWIVERARELENPVVVELCAGSGVISLAISDECPSAEVHAVELSEQAVAWAARNLAGTGVDLREGDMADAFHDLDGRVDLVVANPPYVPLEAWDSVPADVRDHDPALALWSGDDGLDATRVVARVAGRLLRPGGWVASEHAEVQAAAAPEVFVDTGLFDRVSDRRDLTDRPRFVTARRAARPGGGMAG